jgi:threonine/homoserine/homoserine lactone efflux protein
MTLESILTFALAVGALAIKPGAGMTMVMSRAISQGFAAVLAFVMGFCVISVLFLGLVVFGYKFLDVDLIFISLIIKSFAAVYLIWLGVKGLQKAEEPLQVQEMGIERIVDNFTASVMLTLSNPLTIVFYAGILPTVMNVQQLTFKDFAVLAFVICLVEYIVAIAYSSPLLLFRKKIPQSFLRGLSYFSSIVIILVGLYIGYTALPSKDLTSVF